MRKASIEQFVQLIELNTSSECWNWLGMKTKTGYGKIYSDGHVMAHRWSYGFFIGPIPQGMEIHHVCRNRACVNPKHLHLTSHVENCRIDLTKTHCPRGHEYVEGSFYVFKTNSGGFGRACKVCTIARSKAHYRNNTEQHNAKSAAYYLKNKAKMNAQARDRYYRLKAARASNTSGLID